MTMFIQKLLFLWDNLTNENLIVFQGTVCHCVALFLYLIACAIKRLQLIQSDMGGCQLDSDNLIRLLWF